MARATRSCWAPSWMLRSSRRRASSCAVTRRCRDARRSSIRPGVRQHQARLRRHVRDQVLARPGAAAPPWASGSRSRRAARPGARRGRSCRRRAGLASPSPLDRQSRRPRAAFWPRRRGPGAARRPPAATRRPARRRSRPPRCAPSAAARPRCVRAADAPGEVGQHLIRRGPPAVHDPVGQPPGPLAHRLERDRHHRGGQRRQQRAAPVAGQRPHARPPGRRRRR